jgi:hypothetical protein
VSKLRKGLLSMVAVLGSLFVVAQASAATVTVTPSGAKAVTSTMAVRFLISGTSSTTTVTCTGWSMSGTLSSASGTFPIPIGTLNPNGAGCRVAGGIAADATCNVLTVNVTNFSTIDLGLGSLHCTLDLHAMPSCRTTVTGSIPGRLASSQITMFVTGQSLTSAGSTCTTTFVNGTTTFSSSTGGDVVLNVSPATTITVM